MPLHICFFGALRIEDGGGHEVKLPTRRAYLILAYLWLKRDRTHKRDNLASLFWPDQQDEKRARNSLRQELHTIKSILEPYLPDDEPIIITSAESAKFNSNCDVWIDADQFENAITASKHERGQVAIDALEHALALYTGELLQGCYEDWAIDEQKRLRELRFKALKSLVLLHGHLKQYEKAIEYAREILDKQPHNEELLRQMLYLHYANDEQSEALKCYAQHAPDADDKLSAQPHHDTQELVERIKSGAELSELKHLIGELGIADPRHLPSYSDPIIGREREIEEIMDLLKENRMVTIKGVGGAGKTRLAAEVGRLLADKFEHGVRWISLKELVDGEFLPQQIANGLGVKEEPSRPILNSVVDFLEFKDLLLILDNCEHVMKMCRHVAQALLVAAPNLRILATSRESFNIPGEMGWPIPALSLPDEDDDDHTPDSLLDYDGIQLFVKRARERPRASAFNLTSANMLYVLNICRRLDGIPLAIELAAAQVESFAVEDIDSQLSDLMDVPIKDFDTLEATIDWSYNLLNEQEQLLFARMAVFGGSCTLDAIKSICADANLNDKCLMGLIGSLVAQSLVVYAGHRRYHQLETIKAYALKKLATFCNSKHWHERHINFYLALAERAEPELSKANQKAWLDGLEEEHDNFRVALDRSLEHNVPAKGLKLAGALWFFWYIRGHWKEGRYWLESLLEESLDEADQKNIAKGLYAAAAIAQNQGELDVAETVALRSLEIAEALNDVQQKADAQNLMGSINLKSGRHKRAEEFYIAALELYQSIGDESGEGVVSLNLGVLNSSGYGDHECAIRLFSTALDICQSLEDDVLVGKSLWNLGSSYLALCAYDLACRYYEKALISLEELGDLHSLAGVYDSLGAAKKAIALGECPSLVLTPQDENQSLVDAIELHYTALRMSSEIASRFGQAKAMLNIGLGQFCANKLRDAIETLMQALDLCRTYHYDSFTISCLSTLAKTYFCLGHLEIALSYSKEAVELLPNELHERIDEVHFTHFNILRGLNELGKARNHLEIAQSAIMKRANQVSDYQLRESFLSSRKSVMDAMFRDD